MLCSTVLLIPPPPSGIVSDCPLTDYNVTTCSPYTTDNDGLWTSWLVGAESLRYAVTGNTSARENAWSLFQGMAFLNNVSVCACLGGFSLIPRTMFL